jgi:hypothetical protein
MRVPTAVWSFKLLAVSFKQKSTLGENIPLQSEAGMQASREWDEGNGRL